EKWGGVVVSPNGVWRVLRRHGLNTRAKRLGLIAGYAAPYQPPRDPLPEAHIEVERPGELSAWTASSSAGCAAPSTRCGRSRRSTATPTMAGPTSSPALPDSQSRPRPADWPAASLATSPAAAGGSNASSQTTATSSKPAS